MPPAAAGQPVVCGGACAPPRSSQPPAPLGCAAPARARHVNARPDSDHCLARANSSSDAARCRPPLPRPRPAGTAAASPHARQAVATLPGALFDEVTRLLVCLPHIVPSSPRPPRTALPHPSPRAHRPSGLLPLRTPGAPRPCRNVPPLFGACPLPPPSMPQLLLPPSGTGCLPTSPRREAVPLAKPAGTPTPLAACGPKSITLQQLHRCNRLHA